MEAHLEVTFPKFKNDAKAQPHGAVARRFTNGAKVFSNSDSFEEEVKWIELVDR